MIFSSEFMTFFIMTNFVFETNPINNKKEFYMNITKGVIARERVNPHTMFVHNAACIW
jgi:hypothetical protein